MVRKLYHVGWNDHSVMEGAILRLCCCMPKRITIALHLSLDELESRYHQAKDFVLRSHYQIIWLLACGRPTEEVARTGNLLLFFEIL